MAEAYNPPAANEIDFDSLGGLSQEDVNKRLLAAMLMQGSAKYDQAMLQDTLSRSKSVAPPLARGRGKIGEMNDFATAFKPGMERAQAQEMVRQLRAQDMKTMQNILGGGKAMPGQDRAPMLNTDPTKPPPPPVDPAAGMLRQGGGMPAIGMRPGGGPPGLMAPPRVPNPDDPYGLG